MIVLLFGRRPLQVQRNISSPSRGLNVGLAWSSIVAKGLITTLATVSMLYDHLSDPSFWLVRPQYSMRLARNILTV